MSSLTITKGYTTGAALTEAHLDNFRTGLHTLFNVDKFEAENFDPAMSIPSSKFTGSELLTADNTYIEFGNDTDAWIGLDSSKNLVYDTAANTTEIRFYAGSTYYMEVYTDKLYLPGDIEIGSGGSGYTILSSLSFYKKPVLEWNSATSISISNNGPTSTTETIVFFPSGIIAVDEAISASSKFREADISDTANGYGTNHTGAAKGGRRVGLSQFIDSWYAVYIAKVRSGTDYDANSGKFILVFDSVLPTPDNEATLDSRYGEGCWVYAGLIRYGFGEAGSSSSIPKFKYSNKGWCTFYDKSTGHGGVVLATSSTDADNTSSAFYTLTSGMFGPTIPATIKKVQIACVRERVSDWYAKDSDGTIVWRGGWQLSDTSQTHGHAVELPFFTDRTCYSFYQDRKGNGAVQRSVCLIGFCDGYITVRGQGIGI